MVRQPKELVSIKEPAARLQAAIATLEQFTKNTEDTSIPNAADFIVSDGKLITVKNSQFVTLLASFFSQKAKENLQKQKFQVQNAVLSAIDIVKSHHQLLKKYQQGTVEQQKLAEATMEAIESYNTVVMTDKDPSAWRSKLKRYFYKKCGLDLQEELQNNLIDLPPSRTVQYHFVPQSNAAISQRITTTFNSKFSNAAPITPKNTTLPITPEDRLYQQEADVIRMKANTLLRQVGIPFRSDTEMFSSLRKANIQITLDPISQTSTLSLIVEVLPGSTIQVTGSFKRNQQQEAQSIPIKNSFEMIILSSQTGFPYPAQYTGWSLADPLIPSCPHRLSQVVEFKKIYSRKKEIATELQPGGSLVDKAQDLYAEKKKVFVSEARQLLALHKSLNHAIFRAASEDTAIVDKYFDVLSLQDNPMEGLATAYQQINYYFIENMWSKIATEWLENKDSLLFKDELPQNLALAREMMAAERAKTMSLLHEEERSQYFITMGEMIGKASESIILQHLSEVLPCTPPMLTDFEQKLQLAAYKQMQTFLDELTNKDSSQPLYTQMKKNLISDICLFNTESFEKIDDPLTAIVEELEFYYNARYFKLCL